MSQPTKEIQIGSTGRTVEVVTALPHIGIKINFVKFGFVWECIGIQQGQPIFKSLSSDEPMIIYSLMTLYYELYSCEVVVVN